MKKKLCALTALLTAAVMLFTGCSSSGNGGGSGDAEVLRYCITSDLTALDPAFAYDGPTMAVMLQVSEGVMALNPEGHVVPCLAKEAKRVDSTTYVYTIRDEEGRERMIPAIPQVIAALDIEAGRMEIRPLEGLFDD